MTAADLEWGAFPEEAPWVLDRGAVTWRAVADERRADAAREVPRLISPTRLPPGRRSVIVVVRLASALA
ncbi:MAG: AarF/ABC1/UbiB kinase family protein, partial [Acidimicrobiia bacterium]|nr:AarF/ABC1/UbiB kinase family protein [Acidimicrobiia bacterium]